MKIFALSSTMEGDTHELYISTVKIVDADIVILANTVNHGPR
jgi:hypothetical protein